MTNKTLPRIPVPVFEKMLQTLSVEELRSLPAAKLPREIPQALLRDLPDDKREVLDELLFDANTHHVQERMHMEQTYGKHLMMALDQAEQDGDDLVNISDRKAIDSMTAQAQRWLDEDDQSSREAYKRASIEFAPSMRQLSNERARLHSHREVLMDAFFKSQDDDERSDFKAAVVAIKRQEQQLDSWLSKYQVMQLNVLDSMLNAELAELASKEKRLSEVDWEIEQIQKRIETSIKAMKLSKNDINKNHFIQELRSEIDIMEDERNKCDIMIPEENVIERANTFIDAALCPIDNKEYSERLQQSQDKVAKIIEIYGRAQQRLFGGTGAAKSIFADNTQKFDVDQNRAIKSYFLKKSQDIRANGATQEQTDKLDKLQAQLMAAVTN